MGFPEFKIKLLVSELLALGQNVVQILDIKVVDEPQVLFGDLVSGDLLPDESGNVEVEQNARSDAHTEKGSEKVDHLELDLTRGTWIKDVHVLVNTGSVLLIF